MGEEEAVTLLKDAAPLGGNHDPRQMGNGSDDTIVLVDVNRMNLNQRRAGEE